MPDQELEALAMETAALWGLYARAQVDLVVLRAVKYKPCLRAL